MQLNLLTALIGATVPAALANFQGMNAPSTIVLGSPFNISGAFAASDKNGYPIGVWLGVFPFNPTTDPGYVPDRTALGLKLDPFNVDRLGEIFPYYFNLTGFVVPKKLLSQKSTKFYLHWYQIIEFGAANNVAAESYLMGPINVGSQVSSTLVSASVKRWGLQDCT